MRALSESEHEKKLCPRCRLEMNEDPALNALSLDGKTEICLTCGQIESLEKAGAFAQAEGLRIGQKRLQAALYGIGKNGEPNLPGSETKRKAKGFVVLKDEKEFEERYTKFVETPIQDTGDFYTKRRIEGGRIFVDTTGEEVLPEFRVVKCRCGRKLKIWLASKDPLVYAGRCGRCKGGHYIGDEEAVKKAPDKQRKAWLRRAKQTRKKGRW